MIATRDEWVGAMRFLLSLTLLVLLVTWIVDVGQATRKDAQAEYNRQYEAADPWNRPKVGIWAHFALGVK